MLHSAAESALALEPVIERARSEEGAGFECSRDGALWRLCIWGWFPPDWCGNLSLHCYAARLCVQQADTRRLRTSLWAGAFLLAESGHAASPRALDFVHMARHRPAGIGRPGPMEIEQLQIEPDACGGAARVQVAGSDRIGFLAWVLEQLACCGLYPHALSVRTTPDGRAQDRFDVLGSGGTPPLPRALATLEQLLRPRPQPTRAL